MASLHLPSRSFLLSFSRLLSFPSFLGWSSRCCLGCLGSQPRSTTPLGPKAEIGSRFRAPQSRTGGRGRPSACICSGHDTPLTTCPCLIELTRLGCLLSAARSETLLRLFSAQLIDARRDHERELATDRPLSPRQELGHWQFWQGQAGGAPAHRAQGGGEDSEPGSH